MIVSVFESAAYLYDQSAWKINNLQLQKLLFFAQMISLGKHDQELLKEDFYAWDYGPVNAELYNDVKIYGPSPIGQIPSSRKIEPVGLQRSILDITFRSFENLSPSELIRLTHWEHGAWVKYYSSGYDSVVIPKQAIKDEYDERARRFEAGRNGKS